MTKPIEDFVLVYPSEEYLDEISDYQAELLSVGQRSHGDSGLYRATDISQWIKQCDLMRHEETVPNPDWVEADQFMLVRHSDKRVLGMINFRHYLNPLIAETGGHIGYGVRPSERRKGYGTQMLKLCLLKVKEFGLDQVLLTCNTDNEASRKTIIAGGGVFERFTEDEDGPMERYWIHV